MPEPPNQTTAGSVDTAGCDGSPMTPGWPPIICCLSRTRFFSEQYTRLYWNDIQALLLYPFAHNKGLMLGAEVACILAAVTEALVQNRFETIALAFCYVVLYAAWRLTRRNYGVEVLTRTATVRIPLAIFYRSARRLVNQLQQRVEGVQGHLVLAQQVPDAVKAPAAEPAGVEPEPTQRSVVAVTVAGGTNRDGAYWRCMESCLVWA